MYLQHGFFNVTAADIVRLNQLQEHNVTSGRVNKELFLILDISKSDKTCIPSTRSRIWTYFANYPLMPPIHFSGREFAPVGRPALPLCVMQGLPDPRFEVYTATFRQAPF